MEIKLLRGALEKKDLALLDFLVTNNWERPIYLNNTSLSQINIDLRPYAIMEGNAYRILPIRNPNKNGDYLVNTDKAFDNMINKFKYSGLNDERIYFNEDYRGFVMNHRSALNDLAKALILEDKMEKANQVLEFSLEKMPDRAVPYDITAATLVELLFEVGQKEKAIEVANVIGQRADEMITYLIEQNYGMTLELRRNAYVLNTLQRTLYENGEMELGKKFEDALNKHMASLQIYEEGDF
jgi:hypothetical protein